MHQHKMIDRGLLLKLAFFGYFLVLRFRVGTPLQWLLRPLTHHAR